MIKKYKKIVIKIGSSSIIDSKSKKIKSSWFNNLCKDISDLHSTKKIVIVCSGAIALGSQIIKNKNLLRKLENKQAAASVGQIELAQQWKQKLKNKGILRLENKLVGTYRLGHNLQNKITNEYDDLLSTYFMKLYL